MPMASAPHLSSRAELGSPTRAAFARGGVVEAGVFLPFLREARTPDAVEGSAVRFERPVGGRFNRYTMRVIANAAA